MEINYNQLYENAKMEMEDVQSDIDEIIETTKNGKAIYEYMMDNCCDFDEKTISELSDFSKQIRDLIMERDRLDEIMCDASYTYLTREKKSIVERIFSGPDYDYDEDRLFDAESLKPIEWAYYLRLCDAKRKVEKREIQEIEDAEEFGDEEEED